MKTLRITVCALLCLAFALALVSCKSGESAGVPDGYQLVGAKGTSESERGVLAEGKDYYLYVPSSWTVDINNAAASAFAADDENTSVSVMTWTAAEGETPADCWDSYVKEFESVYKDFAVEKREDVTLDGAAAYCVTFTGSLGETALRFRQVTAIKGGLVYLLTYTSHADTFDAHAADFDAILGCFRFK